MPRELLTPFPILLGQGGLNMHDGEAEQSELLDASNVHASSGVLQRRGGMVPLIACPFEYRPHRYFAGNIGTDGKPHAGSDTSGPLTCTDYDALGFPPEGLNGLAIWFGGTARPITRNYYDTATGAMRLDWAGGVAPNPTGDFEVFAWVSAYVQTVTGSEAVSANWTALTNRTGTLSGGANPTIIEVGDSTQFDGVHFTLSVSGAWSTEINVVKVQYLTVAADGTTSWVDFPYGFTDTTVAADATSGARQTLHRSGMISWHRSRTLESDIGNGTGGWGPVPEFTLGGWTPYDTSGTRNRYFVRIQLSGVLGGTVTVLKPGIRTVVRRPMTFLSAFQTRHGRRVLLGGSGPSISRYRVASGTPIRDEYTSEGLDRVDNQGAGLVFAHMGAGDADLLYQVDDEGAGRYGRVTNNADWAGGQTWADGAAGILTKRDGSYNWETDQYQGWYTTFYATDAPNTLVWFLVTKTAAQTQTLYTGARNLTYTPPAENVANSSVGWASAKPLNQLHGHNGHKRWNGTYDPISDKFLVTNGYGPVLEVDADAPQGVIARTLLADFSSTSALRYAGLRADAEDRIFAAADLERAPPTCDFLVSYLDRLVALGANGVPTRIKWSAPGLFNNVWMRVFEAELRDATNRPITGAGVLGDTLCVFKTDTLWVGGPAPFDGMRFSRASQRIGCVSHHTIQPVTYEGHHILIFAGEDGVYAYDGAEPVYLSRKVEPVYRRFAMQGLQWLMSAATYRRRNWYLLAMPDPTGAASYVLVFDYAKKEWWLWDVPIGVFGMASVEDAAGRELLLFSDRDGFVHIADVDGVNDDHGANVSWFVTTHDLMEPQAKTMSFRHLYVEGGDYRGTTPALNVETYVDSQATAQAIPSGGSAAMNFDSGQAKWGTAVWGTAVWGGFGAPGSRLYGAQDRIVRYNLPVTVGQRVRFTFRSLNDGASRAHLRGATLLMAPKSFR